MFQSLTKVVEYSVWLTHDSGHAWVRFNFLDYELASNSFKTEQRDWNLA